jgi:hypothetical protein
LSPSHPLQHIFDCALGARELLRITGTQNHIGVGPELRIEERIATDRDLGISPQACLGHPIDIDPRALAILHEWLKETGSATRRRQSLTPSMSSGTATPMSRLNFRQRTVVCGSQRLLNN